ncbi:hypothetical protein SGCOL_007603 [Colletotrichum sp. CLE4]
MLNWGVEKIDERPVCGFEASAYQAKAPGKTLNAPGDKDASGKQVTLEDCQYWLVEAAGYLVQDRLFGPEVATYLHVIEHGFAGEVASVGKDIQNINDPRVKVEAHVAGFVQGGAFAEYLVIDHDLT